MQISANGEIKEITLEVTPEHTSNGKGLLSITLVDESSMKFWATKDVILRLQEKLIDTDTTAAVKYMEGKHYLSSTYHRGPTK